MQGTEKEVREEYEKLLEKAKNGYGDMVYVFEDVMGTFEIQDTNMRITFSMSQYFREYAIYQILY